MKATLTVCPPCDTYRVSALPLTMSARTVPGTGELRAWNCPHVFEEVGRFDALQLVHVALSTLIRDVLTGDEKDAALVAQARLSSPLTGLHGLPYALVDGYGVSSVGLATARLLVSRMEGLYAASAAGLMRRRIGGK